MGLFIVVASCCTASVIEGEPVAQDTSYASRSECPLVPMGPGIRAENPAVGDVRLQCSAGRRLDRMDYQTTRTAEQGGGQGGRLTRVLAWTLGLAALVNTLLYT